jgi:hypothetical protein
MRQEYHLPGFDAPTGDALLLHVSCCVAYTAENEGRSSTERPHKDCALHLDSVTPDGHHHGLEGTLLFPSDVTCSSSGRGGSCLPVTSTEVTAVAAAPVGGAREAGDAAGDASAGQATTATIAWAGDATGDVSSRQATTAAAADEAASHLVVGQEAEEPDLDDWGSFEDVWEAAGVDRPATLTAGGHDMLLPREQTAVESAAEADRAGPRTDQGNKLWGGVNWPAAFGCVSAVEVDVRLSQPHWLDDEWTAAAPQPSSAAVADAANGQASSQPHWLEDDWTATRPQDDTAQAARGGHFLDISSQPAGWLDDDWTPAVTHDASRAPAALLIDETASQLHPADAERTASAEAAAAPEEAAAGDGWAAPDNWQQTWGAAPMLASSQQESDLWDRVAVDRGCNEDGCCTEDAPVLDGFGVDRITAWRLLAKVQYTLALGQVSTMCIEVSSWRTCCSASVHRQSTAEFCLTVHQTCSCGVL